MSTGEMTGRHTEWTEYRDFGQLMQARGHELRDRSEDKASAHINVGDVERKVSLASGAILALAGLARRDWAGLVIAGIGGGLLWRGSTGHCSMYQALGVDTAGNERGRESAAPQGIEVTQSFLINRSAEELYAHWRKFENLPQIMSHLQAVEEKGNGQSHWRAEAPSTYGGYVEWNAEITSDIPNRRIAWRSLPESDIDNEGSVEFEKAPGDRGTILRVHLHYAPPAGRVGHWIAKLFGKSADLQIREDLRRFKRTIELGEAPCTTGQSHGSCMGLGTIRKS